MHSNTLQIIAANSRNADQIAAYPFIIIYCLQYTKLILAAKNTSADEKADNIYFEWWEKPGEKG